MKLSNYKKLSYPSQFEPSNYELHFDSVGCIKEISKLMILQLYEVSIYLPM